MTFDFIHISHVKPSSKKIVSTVNGNILVTREESLTLIDTLNLKLVVIMLYLNYNFVSVS